MSEDLKTLLRSIRACELCKQKLPHGTNPVLQASRRSRILIAGQAPGRKVHKTGVPFDDASGKTLRNWMGIEPAIFYDPDSVAIVPMGFCFPGSAQSGDLAPLTRCAKTWRRRVLNKLPEIRLTLVIGQYAQKWHMPDSHVSVTDTVQSWQSYPKSVLALPHPSPRNGLWLKKNPWFKRELIPVLRQRVADALQPAS